MTLDLIINNAESHQRHLLLIPIITIIGAINIFTAISSPLTILQFTHNQQAAHSIIWWTNDPDAPHGLPNKPARLRHT